MGGNERLHLEELRGAHREEKRGDGKDRPRNAMSYCAQFGIPIEDVEEKLATAGSHLEMVEWCRSWARDPVFREAAIALETYPMRREDERKESNNGA